MNVLEKILEELETLHNKILKDKFAERVTEQEIDSLIKAKDIIRSHMDEAKDINVPSKDGWIPVEDTDRTPKGEDYILVSFSNFSLADIARYEEDEEGGIYYPGDEDKPYKEYGLFVNAWQPLPKPYRPKEKKQ